MNDRKLPIDIDGPYVPSPRRSRIRFVGRLVRLLILVAIVVAVHHLLSISK